MIKPSTCRIALTLFLLLTHSKVDLPIVSDRLCLSALKFCIIMVIGISCIIG